MKRVELVGGSVLASLAMVRSMKLVMLEEVELVVEGALAVLVEHIACAVLLVHEFTRSTR